MITRASGSPKGLLLVLVFLLMTSTLVYPICQASYKCTEKGICDVFWNNKEYDNIILSVISLFIYIKSKKSMS